MLSRNTIPSTTVSPFFPAQKMISIRWLTSVNSGICCFLLSMRETGCMTILLIYAGRQDSAPEKPSSAEILTCAGIWLLKAWAPPSCFPVLLNMGEIGIISAATGWFRRRLPERWLPFTAKNIIFPMLPRILLKS